MDCAEFLENYSDFLDRRLESRALADYRDHLLSCPSCAAYDRVIQRGLGLVREIPPPNPGPDFTPRLQHRVYHIQDSLARRGSHFVGVSAVAAVAVVGLVMAAWLPLKGSKGRALQLPPVVVEAPAGVSQASTLWGGLPRFGSETSLLLVPDFPGDSWRAATEGRLLLFRAPLRAPKPPREQPVSAVDAE